jgi:hypothetical protein
VDQTRLSEIADEYERLIGEGSIGWSQADLSKLPPNTKSYLEMMLVIPQWDFEVADQVIEDTYLFRIDHPVIKYLHHIPQTDQHMWAGEGFHEALDASKIFMVLIMGQEYAA